MKLRHIVVLLLLVKAYADKVDLKTHELSILRAQKSLGIPQNVEFLKSCDYHDYYILSTVSYKNELISIGFLGNTHIRFSALEQLLYTFDTEQSSHARDG
jgi:hypothetical protein